MVFVLHCFTDSVVDVCLSNIFSDMRPTVWLRIDEVSLVHIRHRHLLEITYMYMDNSEI